MLFAPTESSSGGAIRKLFVVESPADSSNRASPPEHHALDDIGWGAYANGYFTLEAAGATD